MFFSPSTVGMATVLRNVFLKSMQEQRRSLFWWILGMGALNIVTMLFYPSFADRPELNEIFEDLGPLAEAFVGQIEDFTSPAGFTDSQLFSFMIPLLFVAFGIFAGSGSIAGEEERGTLDLLLSNPRHHSLRAKRYDATRFQARVTRSWRFYYRLEDDTCLLLSIIPHPK